MEVSIVIGVLIIGGALVISAIRVILDIEGIRDSN